MIPTNVDTWLCGLRSADLEALLRDAGVALELFNTARRDVRTSGEFQPEHFGMALGDAEIARQLRGVLRSNGFGFVLDAPPSHGIEAQDDFTGHVSRCMAGLRPSERAIARSLSDLTAGQRPVPPLNGAPGVPHMVTGQVPNAAVEQGSYVPPTVNE